VSSNTPRLTDRILRVDVHTDGTIVIDQGDARTAAEIADHLRRIADHFEGGDLRRVE